METQLEGNLPIYMQIMDAIRLSVISGEMKPGQKISSVRDLAQDFNVNPNTMQRALVTAKGQVTAFRYQKIEMAMESGLIAACRKLMFGQIIQMVFEPCAIRL